MDVSHTSGDGVLNRNHGQIDFASGYQFKGVLKAGARNAFEFGKHFLAREIRIGSGLTLVRYLLGHDAHRYTLSARPPNRVHPVTGGSPCHWRSHFRQVRALPGRRRHSRIRRDHPATALALRPGNSTESQKMPF